VTPTDLVFPFFLFIVGVTIPFALGPRLDAGEPQSRLAAGALRRGAVIFALGLLLHAIPTFDLATIRIPGVLQRIAVCFLAAALIFLGTGWRGQATIAAAALLGYWAALTLVPVPGFGAGDLGKEGNLAAWIDRAVLGPHIWRAARVYDPEGILSTVPAVATTLVGLLAGQWMLGGEGPARAKRAPGAMVRGLVAAGGASVVAGLVWGLAHPINKPLWTGPYVLFTGGAALVGLAACYQAIEVRGSRWWTAPFAVLGFNALAVFFLSTLLAKLLVSVRVPAPGGPSRPLQAAIFDALAAWAPAPEIASLAYALAHVALWMLLAWPLYRRGLRLPV
jgi:predicted acyltransferase